MTERIQEAKRQGREVHVVAIVAEKQASGFYTYHPYWDAQPREVMSYMASELVLLAHDPPDDDPIPDLQA